MSGCGSVFGIGFIGFLVWGVISINTSLSQPEDSYECICMNSGISQFRKPNCVE